MRKAFLLVSLLAVFAMAFGAAGARPAHAQFEKIDTMLSIYTGYPYFGAGEKIMVEVLVMPEIALPWLPSGMVSVTGADENCDFILQTDSELGVSKGFCEVIINSQGVYPLTVTYEGDDWYNGTSGTFGVEILPSYTARFRSVATQDGQLRGRRHLFESPVFQNVQVNNTGTTFKVGDDASYRTYMGITSFKTGTLPDDAFVFRFDFNLHFTKVNGTVGFPFDIYFEPMVDLRSGHFGPTAALEADDMNDPYGVESLTGYPTYGGGWYYWRYYTEDFGINKLGTTQLRIFPYAISNFDGKDDYWQFYTGNVSNAKLRPFIEVSYFLWP